MASCFCGCGTKVKFRLRAINTRGARITELAGRVGGLLDAYEGSDAELDLQNLFAFQDEGMLYMMNLVTFIHLSQEPPPALNEISKDWITRERNLFLDVRDPAARMMQTSYAAAKAQGVTDPDAASRKMESGEFDMFAALIPAEDFRGAYEALVALATENQLMETCTPYRYPSTPGPAR
ncbi:MAG: hypothetical protein ACSLFF_04690 [Solirubrobacterales bacterium]